MGLQFHHGQGAGAVFTLQCPAKIGVDQPIPIGRHQRAIRCPARRHILAGQRHLGAVDLQFHDFAEALCNHIGMTAIPSEDHIGGNGALAEIDTAGWREFSPGEAQDDDGVFHLRGHQDQGLRPVHGNAAGAGAGCHRPQHNRIGGPTEIDH